jgi:hypothetical protein
MPKSESKSVAKKTKPKAAINNPEIIADESTKVESYVPKITHWTKAKKDKQEIVEPAQIDDQSTKTLNENKKIDNMKVDPIDKHNDDKTVTTSKLEKLATLKSRFEDESVVKIEEPKNTIIQSENTPSPIKQNSNHSKIGLPSFLNRGSKPSVVLTESENSSKNQFNDKQIPNQVEEKNNSLTSIFMRDQDEISNIKRVFRKSIMFLTFALLSFGLSSLASNSFAIQSFLALLITSFAFIALTNIFFIIVAHRTYVWLFLIGEFIILSITQFPYSTNISTLVIGFVVVLLTYLAYLDLEKVQLGSRLFSIPYIVGESTKILSSVIIFIVCLSTFNQISSKGLDKFLGESLLTVPVFMDRVALPAYQNVLTRGSGFEITDDGNTTVKSLICAERKLVCNTKNNTVLAQEEYSRLNRQCETDLLTETDCAALKDKSEQAVLSTYVSQDFSGLNLSLDTRLTSSNYQPALSRVIQNKIKVFVEPSNFSFLPAAVPSSSLIPFIVSLILFVVLTIFKFILVWFGYIVTWIMWKLLQITGFVRLDIEMVEAEIVGI